MQLKLEIRVYKYYLCVDCSRVIGAVHLLLVRLILLSAQAHNTFIEETRNLSDCKNIVRLRLQDVLRS